MNVVKADSTRLLDCRSRETREEERRGEKRRGRRKMRKRRRSSSSSGGGGSSGNSWTIDETKADELGAQWVQHKRK